MGTWVNKEILRFYVSVTDSNTVYIGQRTEDLVGIEFYKHVRDFVFALSIIFDNFIEIPWDIIHDNVQINFIVLTKS